MNDNGMQSSVRAFNIAMGCERGETPAIRTGKLRADLIAEEARETVDAILADDLVQTIDGLCDLLYVVFGAADVFGIELAPFFAEVHRTNMLKLDGPRRADGKILKPAGWKPPRIGEMLEEVMRGEPARPERTGEQEADLKRAESNMRSRAAAGYRNDRLISDEIDHLREGRRCDADKIQEMEETIRRLRLSVAELGSHVSSEEFSKGDEMLNRFIQVAKNRVSRADLSVLVNKKEFRELAEIVAWFGTAHLHTGDSPLAPATRLLYELRASRETRSPFAAETVQDGRDTVERRNP